MYGKVKYKKCDFEQVEILRLKEEELKVVLIIETVNWRIVLPLQIRLVKSWEYKQAYMKAIETLKEIHEQLQMGTTIDLDEKLNTLRKKCERDYYRANLLNVEIGSRTK